MGNILCPVKESEDDFSDGSLVDGDNVQLDSLSQENFRTGKANTDENRLSESSGSRTAGVHEERVVDGFRLIRTLWQGGWYGFEWVKQARSLESGNMVALKLVKKAPYTSIKFGKKRSKLKRIYQIQQEEFETEVTCLLKLKSSSQYVVQLLTYNEECKYPNNDHMKPPIDTYMLALEYAPMGELFDISFYARKGLDEKLARTWMFQIFKGLQAIHAAGIIHRNMKLQNILLAKDFTLRIADFGGAHILSEGEENVSIKHWFGSKGYRAPECELGMCRLPKDSGMTYNKSCDVFSCGFILFLLLTGYPPFSISYSSPSEEEEEPIAPKDSCHVYAPIQNDDMEEFWDQAHCQMSVLRRKEIRDLISSCLRHNPQDRSTVQECLESEWLKEPIYSSTELPKEVEQLYKSVNEARDLNPRLDLAAVDSLGSELSSEDQNLRLGLAAVESLGSELSSEDPIDLPAAKSLGSEISSEDQLDLEAVDSLGSELSSFTPINLAVAKSLESELSSEDENHQIDLIADEIWEDLDEAQKNMIVNMVATADMPSKMYFD